MTLDFPRAEPDFEAQDDMGRFGCKLTDDELDDFIAARTPVPPMPAEACSELGFEHEQEESDWGFWDFLLVVSGGSLGLVFFVNLVNAFAKALQ